jgi:hypothetical protein
MVEYETFDDWFDEVENYGCRFERFYEELHNAKDSVRLADLTTVWLRAAFESARLTKDTTMSGFQSKKQMAENRWVVELQQDGEDLILQFTDEMLETTGWKEGDELLWEKAPGNAWTLRKKP